MADDQDQTDGQDWDTPFVKSEASGTDSGWDTPFVKVGTQAAPLVPQATGVARLEMIPEALATGTQDLLGLPGTVQDLANKYAPGWMTRPIGSYFDPTQSTAPQHIFPTGADIAAKTGLGLENRPDLAPQNALERYGVAGIEAIPGAAAAVLTGGASLPMALATAEGGALGAQGAHDLAPNNKWLPIVAGIVGSLGAGGTANWVSKTLDAKQLVKSLGDAQSQLDDAVTQAAAAKNPAGRNALSVADANRLDGNQAQLEASNIQRASAAALAKTKAGADATIQAASQATQNTFDNTASLLGKSKSLEDAGRALQSQARAWLDGPATTPGTMAAKLKLVSDPLEASIPGETPVQLDNFTHALGTMTAKAGTLQGVADQIGDSLPRRLLKAMGKNEEGGEAQEALTGEEAPPTTWNDVRALRTTLGDAMKDPTAVKGISQQNLAYLYKALTNDLGATAREVSPEAGEAWNAYNSEASRLYGLASGVMSKITTTGKEGFKPGKVAAQLIRDAGVDSTDLTALRGEIPTGVDELAAAQLRQGSAGWSKISPESRKVLVPATETTSSGVLDNAILQEQQAASNARQAVSDATATHSATVQQAQDDLKAGNFQRSQALREAQRAEAQAKFDSDQRITSLRQQVAGLQARLPAKASPADNLAATIKQYGRAALGYGEAPELAGLLHLPIGPTGRAAIALGALALPKALQGLGAAARNPWGVAQGALAGQNALALPGPR